MEPKPGSKFASQRIVFDNLGQGVLDNAFEGKNSLVSNQVRWQSNVNFQVKNYDIFLFFL